MIKKKKIIIHDLWRVSYNNCNIHDIVKIITISNRALWNKIYNQTIIDLKIMDDYGTAEQDELNLVIYLHLSNSFVELSPEEIQQYYKKFNIEKVGGTILAFTYGTYENSLIYISSVIYFLSVKFKKNALNFLISLAKFPLPLKIRNKFIFR